MRILLFQEREITVIFRISLISDLIRKSTESTFDFVMS